MFSNSPIGLDWFFASLYCITLSVLAKIVKFKLPKNTLWYNLSYERLVSEPEVVISEIGKKLEMEVSAVETIIRENKPVVYGDQIATNSVLAEAKSKNSQLFYWLSHMGAFLWLC